MKTIKEIIRNWLGVSETKQFNDNVNAYLESVVFRTLLEKAISKRLDDYIDSRLINKIIDRCDPEKLASLLVESCDEDIARLVVLSVDSTAWADAVCEHVDADDLISSVDEDELHDTIMRRVNSALKSATFYME